LVITLVYYFWVLSYDADHFNSIPLDASETTAITKDESRAFLTQEGAATTEQDSARKDAVTRVFELIGIIKNGANEFLYAEFKIMGLFVFVFAIIIFFLTGFKGKATFADTASVDSWKKTSYEADWWFGLFSTVSFVVGALTSMLAGFIGMRIAVVTNGRVTLSCALGSLGQGFAMAIKGGMVMGFGLLSIGLMNVLILIGFYKLYYSGCNKYNECELNHLYDAVAAYGLGGSSIALFGRVGGGIYTKAADVGADLVAKAGSLSLPEDDCRNPATIADNVGDNVGDIAGMGSDLFGSFAEGTCAAMVILSSANNCIYWSDGNVQAVASNFSAMCFPISITAGGILVCYITSLFATHCGGTMRDESTGFDKTWEMTEYKKDSKYPDNPVETTLKLQLLISTVLMTPMIFGLCFWLLPESFFVSANLGVYGGSEVGAHRSVCEANIWNPVLAKEYTFGNWPTATEDVLKGVTCMGEKNILAQEVMWWEIGICVTAGLWAGLTIGYITEYYTSKSYRPVKEIAEQCMNHEESGASVNIIFGLALGYLSVVVPVIALTIAIYTGYALAQMFGVAAAALGMMSTVAICLTIDGYGPISDNAGGIAEMVKQIPDVIRAETDCLDAAGNTTAAIGKGFAIGSAAMVALALFGGYCTRADIRLKDVSILEPMTFAGLLLGAMLPYWFSAMTMKSVGKAASDMMEQCREQFEDEQKQWDPSTEAEGWWTKNKDKMEKENPNAYNDRWRIFESVKNETPVIHTPPNCWYTPCIEKATESSLKEMIPPACLVMLSPLVIGIFFGKFMLSGLLIGAVVSGVQVALSASNTGGAWDNAKKFATNDWKALSEKKPDWKKACVIGDTVGDPLKDTSGPAVNIVMKLMAIIALVTAPFVADMRDGYGLIGCSLNRNCDA
jgi:inorganic pyrophosphatase